MADMPMRRSVGPKRRSSNGNTTGCQMQPSNASVRTSGSDCHRPLSPTPAIAASHSPCASTGPVVPGSPSSSLAKQTNNRTD